MMELLGKLAWGVFGLGMFAGFFGFSLYRDAVRWRHLAKHYAHPWIEPLETRTGQSAILYGLLPAYKAYKGILVVGANHKGIALRVMKPFSVFHQPLFIPYADIDGWQQTWYLDSKSIELSLRSVPEVKLTMPAEQIEWIQSFSGGQMALRYERSPHDAKPTGWYVFTIVQSVAILGGLAWLFLSGKLPPPGVN